MPNIALTPKECQALLQDDPYAEVWDKVRRATKTRDGAAAGKRFERSIAKDIRQLLGAGWTVSRNQTDRQKGQVGDGAGEYTITHSDGRVLGWTFELKDGSGFELAQLWRPEIAGPLATTPKREGFWAQASRQARAVGRSPVLIFRPPGDSRHELTMLRPADLSRLLASPLSAGTGPVLMRYVDGEAVVIVRWDVLRTAPGWVA